MCTAGILLEKLNISMGKYVLGVNKRTINLTHDILFKIKMLSYLEVAYVFNNINVFIYQYL